MDDRFKKVLSDPKFRTLKKKDRKLKIDKRFKSMFEDDKFKLKYARDKRGKTNKGNMSEDYKRFYRLSDDEEDVKEEEEGDKEEVAPVEASKKKPASKKQDSDNEGEEDDENVEDEDIDEEEDEEEEEESFTKGIRVPRGLTHKAGYHRGFRGDDDDDDGESSSSSSDSEEEEEEEDLEHEWNELDRDAERGEDVSRRVAICNADWDRFNAQDMFVLLNSFKPSTGVIQMVKIYYSKFGEERLKIEETKGPSEFIYGKGESIVPKDEDDDEADVDEDDDDENDDDEDRDKAQKNMEKLRKYQLERLKYFFALVVCDSPETADAIYKELDGMEYESSASTLDLRFVPDDMDFDEYKLKEECSALPNSANYKPPEFINTALQQSQVKLTWDETDQRRKQVFEKAFDKDVEDDLKAYLASSSDEEDNVDDDEGDDDCEDDGDKIAKYKQLLNSLDNDDEEVDMQVTWDPTLQDKVFGKKDNEEEEQDKKGKQKNKASKDIDEFVDNHSSEFEDEEDDEERDSDDESEEEVKEQKSSKSNSKQKLGKKKGNKKNGDFEESEEVDNEDASKLELLMMDVDNNNDQKKKHFNYKNIVDKYSKNQTVEDDFKFDAEDPRFSAIYSSHLYNVDQSDPNFKRTDAFKQIIDNKKKRGATDYVPKVAPTRAEPAWKSLAKKVKLNVEEKQTQKSINAKSKPNKFRVDTKFKR